MYMDEMLNLPLTLIKTNMATGGRACQVGIGRGRGRGGPRPTDVDGTSSKTRVSAFLNTLSTAGKHNKSKLCVLIARKKNERSKKLQQRRK